MFSSVSECKSCKKAIKLESQKISKIHKLNVTKYTYPARHLMTFVLQNYVKIRFIRLYYFFINFVSPRF